MPDFSKVIEVIVKTTADQAKSGLAGLKSSVGEAEGAFGKLKAGAGGAFDAIGSMGPVAIAGVGAAVGAFALSAVGDFSELALSAQNFSAAAGTSVEDASRWIEVAGDLGVNTDAVQGAMGRLNREADQGKLEQYGITAQNANDRLTQTLQYLASIPDEAARSQAQFELLGKGGAALSPLIANVGTLNDRLKDVSDQKVITDEEAGQARRYADAMDNLSDSFDDFKLLIGEALIGPLTEAAESIGDVIAMVQRLIDFKDGLSDLTGGVADFGGAFTNPIGAIGNLTQGLSRATDFSAGWEEQLKGVGQTLTGNLPVIGGWASSLFGADDAQEGLTDAQIQGANAVNNETAAIQAQDQATQDAEKSLRSLTDATLAQFSSQLGYQDATRNTTDKIAEYKAKLDEATAAGGTNVDLNHQQQTAMDEAAQAALREAGAHVKLMEDEAAANGETLTASQRNQALVADLSSVAQTLAPGNPLRTQLEGYISKLLAVPDKVHTDAELDTSSAEAKMAAWLAQPRSTTVTVHTVTSRIDPSAAGGATTTDHAAGGDVAMDRFGEAGPELGIVDSTGWHGLGATDTRAMARGMGRGASVTNVIIQRSALQSERDIMALVAKAQRRYQRLNGTVRII